VWSMDEYTPVVTAACATTGFGHGRKIVLDARTLYADVPRRPELLSSSSSISISGTPPGWSCRPCPSRAGRRIDGFATASAVSKRPAE
jgi:hypothetical protein